MRPEAAELAELLGEEPDGSIADPDPYPASGGALESVDEAPAVRTDEPAATPADPTDALAATLARAGLSTGVRTETRENLFSAFASTPVDEAEKEARIARLAADSRVAPGVIRSRFDEFQAAFAAADFDPERFRLEAPAAYDVVRARPALGPIVKADEKLTLFSRSARLVDAFHARYSDEREKAIASLLPEGVDDDVAETLVGALAAGYVANRAMILGGLKFVDSTEGDGDIERALQPREVAFVEDARAATVRDSGPGAIAAAAFEDTLAQHELARTGFELSLAVHGHSDPETIAALEAKIADLTARASPRRYATNEVEQLLVDAGANAGSLATQAKGAGLGGLVLGGLGLAGGALAGGRLGAPGAIAGARAGLGYGLKLGGAAAMFPIEAGSTYLELREEVSDPDLAFGAALVYGAVASGIESFSFGAAEKAAGPLGDAILKGTGKAKLRELLKDEGFARLAKKAALAFMEHGGAEGSEEFAQAIAAGLTKITAKGIDASGTGDLSQLSLSSYDAAAMRPIYSQGFEEAAAVMAGMGPGSIALAGGRAASERAVGYMLNRRGSTTSALAVEAIHQLEGSKLGELAPDEAAAVVDRVTAAATGEPVRSLYIDPEILGRLFQDADVDLAAHLGPELVAAVKRASDEGTKVEIPARTYVERILALPNASAFARHATTREAYSSRAELDVVDADLRAEARAVFRRLSGEEAAAETPATPAARSLAALHEKLAGMSVNVGGKRETIGTKAAAKMLAIPAAVARVLGEQIGVDGDELLAGYLREIVQIDTRSRAAPSEAAAVEAVPAAPPRDRGTLITPARPDGEAVRYRIVEASSLETSHDPVSFLPTPGFPEQTQERQYHLQPEEQAKVLQGSARFSPELVLSDDPTAANGPPMATASSSSGARRVIGGTGRTMMIARVLRDPALADRRAAYLTALADVAQRRGLSLEGLREPVLVRELEDLAYEAPPAELVAAFRRTNETLTQRLSPIVRAFAEARTLAVDTIGRIADLLAADPEASLRDVMRSRGAELVEILRADAVVTAQNRAEWLTLDGSLTDEAKDRLERMFLARVVGTPERYQATAPALLRKLERIVPSLLKVAGRNEQADEIPLVQSAVDLLNEAAKRRISLRDLVSQISLFQQDADVGPDVDAAIALQKFLEGSVVRGVQYHGTIYGRNFDVFAKRPQSREIGHHFGTQAAAERRLLDVGKERRKGSSASGYAPAARILPVYLSIKNPIVLAEDPGNFTEARLRTLLVQQGIATEAELEPISELARGEWYETQAREELTRLLERKGFDGFVYPNAYEGTKGELSYAVFRSSQVKSALGNRGTYDPRDLSILYQSGTHDPLVVRMAQILDESKPLALAERFRAWATLASFDPKVADLFDPNPTQQQLRAALAAEIAGPLEPRDYRKLLLSPLVVGLRQDGSPSLLYQDDLNPPSDRELAAILGIAESSLPLARRAREQSRLGRVKRRTAREAEYGIDPLTGALARRSFEAIGVPPGFSVAAITTTDAKPINDHPTHGGHDVTNELFVGMANALSDQKRLARSGTTFLFFVAKEKAEAAIAAALTTLRRRIGQKVAFVGAVADSMMPAFQALDLRVDELRASGELSPKGVASEGLDVTTFRVPSTLQGKLEGAKVPESIGQFVEKASARDYMEDVYLERFALTEEEIKAGKKKGDHSGLLTAEGYAAIPRKAYQLAMDLRALSATNKRFSSKAGDQMIREFQRVFTIVGAAKLDGAHLSGDEFVCQSDNEEELLAFAEELERRLGPLTFEWPTGDGGFTLIPVGYRYGIGRTYGEADRELNAKRRAEADAAAGLSGAEGGGAEVDRRPASVRAREARLGSGRRAWAFYGAAPRPRFPDDLTRASRSAVELRENPAGIRPFLPPTGGAAPTTRDVAIALERWTLSRNERISDHDFSDDAVDKVADAIVDEVVYELAPARATTNGVGWYTVKWQNALDLFARIYPEIGTDKAARGLFTALFAICSNGQEVSANAQLAIKAFGPYSRGGRFDANVVSADRAAIRAGIANLQDTLDKLGSPEAVLEHLLETDTITALGEEAEARGMKFSTDYPAHLHMPRAVVLFGPKIGAFFANLMGETGYLTMDRWWVRFGSRVRGRMVDGPKQTGLDKLRGFMGKPDASFEEVLAFSTIHRNKYAARKYKNGTKLEKAANTVFKDAFENIRMSPAGPGERLFWIKTAQAAQKKLAELGHELTIADIQAALWSSEKRIYAQLGARATPTKSYKEVADLTLIQVDVATWARERSIDAELEQIHAIGKANSNRDAEVRLAKLRALRPELPKLTAAQIEQLGDEYQRRLEAAQVEDFDDEEGDDAEPLDGLPVADEDAGADAADDGGSDAGDDAAAGGADRPGGSDPRSARSLVVRGPAGLFVVYEPPTDPDAQLRSPGFRRWFRDSLIREGKTEGTWDPKGKRPLSLFHGMHASWEAFDPTKLDKSGDWGAGLYLTTSAEDASRYASDIGESLSEIRFRTETLVDAGMEETEAEDLATAEVHPMAGSMMRVFVALRNPLVVGGKNETKLEWKAKPGQPAVGSLAAFVRDLEAAASKLEGVDPYEATQVRKIVDAVGALGAAKGRVGALEIKRLVDDAEVFVDDAESKYLKSKTNELVRHALEAAGFDGIVDTSVAERFDSPGKGTIHVVAFRPEQVKSAFANRGTFDPNNPSILYQTDDEVLRPVSGFFSAVEVALGRTRRMRGSIDAWVKELKRQPFVRDEEIEFLDLRDGFKGRTDPITRAELVDYIATHKLDMRERKLGFFVPVTWGEGAVPALRAVPFWAQLRDEVNFNAAIQRGLFGDSKLYDMIRHLTGMMEWKPFQDDAASYRGRVGPLLDGIRNELESYAIDLYAKIGNDGRRADVKLLRSTLALVTEARERFDAYDWEALDEQIYRERRAMTDPRGGAVFSEHQTRLGYDYRELVFYAPGTDADDFSSKGHWNDPEWGVVAHARLSTAALGDGRSLLIEELQSDIHQAGAADGYAPRRSRNPGFAWASEWLKTRRNRYKVAQIESTGLWTTMVGGVALETNPQQFDTFEEAAAHVDELVEQGHGILRLDDPSTLEPDDVAAIDPKAAAEFAAIRARMAPEELDRLWHMRTGLRRSDAKAPVPAAPMRDSWAAFGFKRLLLEAVDRNLDGIAWTAASVQVARWGKSTESGMRRFYDHELVGLAKRAGRQFGVRPVRIKRGKHELWQMRIPADMRAALAAGPLPLWQPDGKKEDPKPKKPPRGFIEPIAPNGYRITLTERADLSTFLHESGHMIFEMFADAAARPDAPPKLKADFQRLLEYLNVDTRDEVGRDQHEQIARSMEAYLREGRAPSRELRRAFSSFRRWLVGIYRSQAALRVELSDEVRGVFDRLIATDAEIATQAGRIGLSNPLPVDVLDLDPKEAAAYSDEVREAEETAASYVARQLADEALREHESWWKSERTAELATARAAYDALPAVRARQLLEGAVAVPGGDALIVDPVSLEEAAELVGYESPEALRADLARLPARETWARATADRAMHDRHPGALEKVQGLTDLVLRGVADGDVTVDHIIRERDALWRRAAKARGASSTEAPATTPEASPPTAEAGGPGKPPAGRQAAAAAPEDAPRPEWTPARAGALREAARMLVDRLQIREVRPHRYLVAERTAAARQFRAATKRPKTAAGLARSMAEAARWAERRVWNLYLWREARDAAEELEGIYEWMRARTSSTYRAGLGHAHESLLDLHDAVLRALQIADPAERTSDGLGALGAVEATFGPTGEVAFDVALIRNLLTTPRPWRDLTVAEAREVRDALRNVRTIANNANEIALGEEKRRIEEIVAGLDEGSQPLPDLGVAPIERGLPSPLRTARDFALGLHGKLVDPELLFGLFGETGRAIWKRYLEVRKRKLELTEKVLVPFQKELERLEADRDRWKVIDELEQTLPLPPDVSQSLGGPRTRMHLFLVLLNLGNESNAERLLGGYGWEGPQVLAVLRKHLPQVYFDVAQRIFDLNDRTLWPELEAKERRKTGLPPGKIPASEIVTPDGSIMRGGYFPARYDPRAGTGDVGERQALAGVERLLAPGYRRAATMKSHVKERAVHYANVVNLDFSVLPSHYAQVVHDVAADEFVRDLGRIFFHPTAKRVFLRRLGKWRMNEPRDWAQFFANEHVVAFADGAGGFRDLLAFGRSRIVVSAIGLSLSTAAGDLSNPLVAAALGSKRGGISARWTVPAMFAALPFPGTYSRIRAFALERSAELRARAQAVRDEERRRFMAQFGRSRGGATRARDAVAGVAWFFMEHSSKIASTQVWLASFWEQSSNGKSEAEAAELADAAVRATLPSEFNAEKSALLRDPGSIGGLLVFYGYFSKLYSITAGRLGGSALRAVTRAARQRTPGATADAALEVAEVAGRALAVYFAAGVVGEFLAGRGPERGEPLEDWILRKMLATPLLQFPVVGSMAASALESAMLGRPSSGAGRGVPAVDIGVRVLEGLGKATSEERSDVDRAFDGLAAVLTIAGLPAAAPVRAGRYVGKLATGTAADSSPPGVVSGMVYGERQDQPDNPANVFSR